MFCSQWLPGRTSPLWRQMVSLPWLCFLLVLGLCYKMALHTSGLFPTSSWLGIRDGAAHPLLHFPLPSSYCTFILVTAVSRSEMAFVLLSLISFNLTKFPERTHRFWYDVLQFFFIFPLLSVVDTIVLRAAAMSSHTSSAILPVHMYVCMYVCKYVCMYVCMYVCIF